MRRLVPGSDEVDLAEAYGRLDPHPSGRPGVRLNMIASADGATALDGRSGGLAGPADRRLLVALRGLADVILVGAGTLRAEGYGPARLRPEIRERRLAAGWTAVPPIAVVTRTARLDWSTRFFTEAVERPIVLTTAAAPDDERGAAEKVAEVVVVGEEDVDLAVAMAALGTRGHRDVLAEGGPALGAGLAAAGVLDELCLTVAPLLVAGPSKRVLDGPVLGPPAGLELAGILEEDGYLFLRYRCRGQLHNVT